MNIEAIKAIEKSRKKMIDSIVLFIDSIFPDYKIAEREIFQDLEPPRFLVTCISGRRKDRIKNAGFFYTCDFDVLFDPGVDGTRELCDEVAFILETALDEIPESEEFNFRPYEISDSYDPKQNVLHVFFSVQITIREFTLDEIPDIRELDIHTKAEVI